MIHRADIISRRDTLQHLIEAKRQSIRADMAAFNASGDEAIEARIADTVKAIRALQPELASLQAALKPPPPPPVSAEARAQRERALSEERKRSDDVQLAKTALQRLLAAFQQGKTPEEAARKVAMPLEEVRAFYALRERRNAERKAAIARNKLAVSDLMAGDRQCDVMRRYGIGSGIAQRLANKARRLNVAGSAEISSLADDAPLQELKEHLKVRTWNALRNEEACTTVGAIRKLTKADLENLMRAPNFGRGSLKDLCSVFPVLGERWGRKL